MRSPLSMMIVKGMSIEEMEGLQCMTGVSKCGAQMLAMPTSLVRIVQTAQVEHDVHGQLVRRTLFPVVVPSYILCS